DAGGGAHKRWREGVAPELERKLEILEVLPRQRRNRNRHAGEVDALVGGDTATDQYGAACAPLLDLLDVEANHAVVHQHLVAGTQDLADGGRCDRQLSVAPVGADDDSDLGPGGEVEGLRVLPDPELR